MKINENSCYTIIQIIHIYNGNNKCTNNEPCGKSLKTKILKASPALGLMNNDFSISEIMLIYLGDNLRHRHVVSNKDN